MANRLMRKPGRQSLNMVLWLVMLWMAGGLAVSAQTHDPDAWRTEFSALADQDLEAARAFLSLLRDEALASGDGQAMVTFAQSISDHARFSADHDQSLIDLKAFLDSGALDASQSLQVKLARVAVLIHQRNLSQAQSELDLLVGAGLGPSERATLLMLQGHIKQTAGEYADAVSAYINALALAERTWPPERLAVLYNNLGNTNHYLRQHPEAIAYFQRALQLYADLGRSRDQIAIIANLGGTLRASGRIEEAVSLYEESLAVVDQVAFPDLRAQFYMNLGNAYTSLQRFDEGLTATSQALAISEAHGIDYGVALSHLNIGLNRYKAGLYAEALSAYDFAYVYFQGDANRYERRQLLRNYADLYAAMGDFELAHQFERRHSELDRTLVNLEARAASEEIQTRYETQLKDAELELRQSVIVRQRGQLLALLAVLLVLVTATVVVVLFLVERNRNLQALYERNRELARRSKLMLQASAERTTEELAGSRPLYEAMVKAMEEQNLYANPELSLADLASAVNSNTSYVSRAIAEYGDSNFNHFVNAFRVQAARRLIHDNPGRISVQQLIDACGFNSRSSFYRSFDRFVGLTPAQYIRRSMQDMGDKPAAPGRAAEEMVDTRAADH